MNAQRTDLAEEFVARFASVPLIAESVLLRPSYVRGNREREVADVVLLHREHAIIVSLKHQADPQARSTEKAARWSKSHAAEAAASLTGAIRTLRSRDLWCQHHRRGRVNFKIGELEPIHAIAAVEFGGGIVSLSADAPLVHEGVPISYFSVNDLLNLILELRSFPELQTYLATRASLPDDTLRALGGEHLLYEQYLLNEGGFAGWWGFKNAEQAHELHRQEIEGIISEKHRFDRAARFVEEVADRLSKRLPGHLEGLPSHMVAQFDPSDARKNYLKMQEELCDLTLLERRALGQLRDDVVSKVEEDTSPLSLVYRAYVDRSRDRLYVVAASRGYERPAAIEAANRILIGGLAYYQKQSGIMIVQRLGENFEIAWASGFSQHAEYKRLGDKLFAHVTVSEFVGSLATGPQRATKPRANNRPPLLT